MTSTAKTHGIRDQAWLYFSSGMTSYSDGTVTFPDPLTYSGMTITSYLNPEAFHQIYALLEAEKPVWFRYGYEDPVGNPGGQSVPLYWSTFQTGEEPVGEGEERTALLPLVRFFEGADLDDEEKEELRAHLPESVFESGEQSS